MNKQAINENEKGARRARPFARTHGAGGGAAVRAAVLLAAVFGTVGAATPAAAAAQSARAGGDFLLGTPKATLAVRIGWNLPREGGGTGAQPSLWDHNRKELTVTRGDFGGLFLEGELGIWISERFDATVSAGRTEAKTVSEFRGFVGEDDLPIAQTTEFALLPLTAGVKAYLFKRGHGVGRFAWIPRRWNAYAGVSGGVVRWRFQQYGEFVDFETLDIFRDDFRGSGTAATLQLRAGVEVAVHQKLLLTGESRYGFGSGQLGLDFDGFADLDLHRFQVTGGIALRF